MCETKTQLCVKPKNARSSLTDSLSGCISLGLHTFISSWLSPHWERTPLSSPPPATTRPGAQHPLLWPVGALFTSGCCREGAAGCGQPGPTDPSSPWSYKSPHLRASILKQHKFISLLRREMQNHPASGAHELHIPAPCSRFSCTQLLQFQKRTGFGGGWRPDSTPPTKATSVGRSHP